MAFNPNELVLERVRYVEEYDIATKELTGRYTQIEDPSLQTSAESTEVTDAMGSVIARFYRSQEGTFSFTNSLFSLDLAASQFGSKKEIADEDNKIIIPVSETITLGSDATATLQYVPVGTTGAEVAYAKVVNEDNNFGKTYKVSAVAGDDVFTIDAENKKLTFPEGTTGRVFVQYEHEAEKAVKLTKRTDGIPEVKSLLIHVIFHDVCDTNKVIAGVISVPRAQINPESVEINLTSEGKHQASYILQKDYCSPDGELFTIYVSED